MASKSATDDQVRANGSIRLKPSLKFNLRIRRWTVETLELTAAAREPPT